MLLFFKGPANCEDDNIISDRLLSKLREHTIPGQKELGVLIDRETGELKQMVVGNRKSVRLNISIQESIEDCVSIHTHATDDAFSGQDWDAFTVADNINMDLLVTPKSIFTLRKTEVYNFLPTQLNDQRPSQYWLKRREEIKSSGIADQAAIERVNEELAEMHGVEYERRTR